MRTYSTKLIEKVTNKRKQNIRVFYVKRVYGFLIANESKLIDSVSRKCLRFSARVHDINLDALDQFDFREARIGHGTVNMLI